MKRTIFSVLAVVVLAGLTGCITQHGRRPWNCMGGSCAQSPENCQSCEDCDNGRDPGRLRCRNCGGRGARRGLDDGQGLDNGVVESGPPTGTVTYPYYTTRGPRDFLAKNPRSIGP